MAEYVIGYGKPPTGHRFVSGQSGNPQGRPKRKILVFEEIVAAVLSSPVSYTERGRKKTNSRIGLVINTLVDQAIAGDVAAAADVLMFLRTSKVNAPGSGLQVEVTDWLPEFEPVSAAAAPRSSSEALPQPKHDARPPEND